MNSVSSMLGCELCCKLSLLLGIADRFVCTRRLWSEQY